MIEKRFKNYSLIDFVNNLELLNSIDNELTNYKITDDNDNKILKIPFCGFKKDEITIELIDSERLKITANSKREDAYQTQKTNIISLPRNVDTDKIDAKLEDGILNISLSKKVYNKIKVI